MDNNSNTFTVHNKISSNFRELHVDGAYGGITPRGLINLNFYAEKFPIPKSSNFKIIPGSNSVETIENSSESNSGIIREYEIGVYLDINVAKNIVEFLKNKISELEQLNEQTNANFIG